MSSLIQGSKNIIEFKGKHNQLTYIVLVS